MNDFLIFWFFFKTKTGRVILGLAIIYAIISILKWWAILVVAVIAGLIILSLYLEGKKDKKAERANALHHKSDIHRIELTPEQKSEKTKEVKAKHPDAINYSSDSKESRFYWLTIGKGKNRKEEFDNKIFKVKFTIAKDLCGMHVSITNTSKDVIEVDWRSFVINRSRVRIDGVVYASYESDGKLNPGESATKLLQRNKDCFSWGVEKLFDLNEIDKKEIKYDITFDIIDENNMRKTFVFDVYTALTIIS